jgi:hypothetical protein
MRLRILTALLLLMLYGCGGHLATKKMFDVPNLPQTQICQVLVNGHVSWIFKNHKSLSTVQLNDKPLKISGIRLAHLLPGKYTISGKHTAIRYLIPQSEGKRKAAQIDEKEVACFDSFFNESGLFFGFPCFSPDSQRIALTAFNQIKVQYDGKCFRSIYFDSTGRMLICETDQGRKEIRLAHDMAQ